MSPLYTKLQQLGGLWTTLSSSKLNNILQLSCCILKTRSCNLQKCRDELASVTGEISLKQSTAYSRLKRVFQTGVILPIQKALFLIVLYLVQPQSNALLILDRTEFGVGSRWINLLVIGLEWHNVFIPLVWRDLGTRGVSSQEDRIDLLNRLLAWWKATDFMIPTLYITGDREFSGHIWLMALENLGINYVMRLKSNLRFPLWFNGQLKDKLLSLKVVARYMLKYGKQQMEVVIAGTVITQLMIFEQENPNDKEPFVLLISNLGQPQKVQAIFRKRWPIECCFKHMKSNGFDLEDVHLEGAHKIDLLFAILSFVYVLAIQQGIISGFKQKVKLKKDKNGKYYPEQSLFRFGLYQLKLQVKELRHFLDYLFNLLEQTVLKCKKLIFEKIIVQS